MKFVFLAGSIPDRNHGGGGVTAFSIASSFPYNGHELHLVVVEYYNNKKLYSYSDEQNIIELKNNGIQIHKIIIPDFSHKFMGILFKIYRRIFPYDIDFLYHQHLKKKLIDLIKPDGIVTYHWENLALIKGLREYPCIGLVGDPMHLPTLYRLGAIQKYDPKISIYKNLLPHIDLYSISNIKLILRIKQIFITMGRLFSRCEQKGAFAAHHSLDLSTLLKQTCKYYRTPVPDPLIQLSTIYTPINTKIKILHIGHLKGTATLSGLSILIDDIIPILDQQIGTENYEVHLVGGYFDELPQRLKTKIENHPSIKVRGQISPPHEEFLTAHMLIVPTPIELGIRVRIVSAFSYGTPVVTHISNTKGIPELLNGINCLIGKNGEEIGKACVQLALNKDLRDQLSKMGRLTFENYFSYSTAGLAIVEDAVSMVNNYRSKNQ